MKIVPNRYVRESAIESEAVNAISWQAEVFYRRLLNRVDDFGRYTATTAILRASIFPLQLEQVRETDIPRLLAECEKAGLLYVYSAGPKRLLVLNKWEIGRAKRSEYPPPPDNISKQLSAFVYERSHSLANAPDSDSDSDPDSDPDSDNKPAELPDELSTEAFVSKWAEYVQYRRQNRMRSLKPASVRKQWKLMATWGPDAAVEAIDTTIRNSWQGLFEPKNGSSAGYRDRTKAGFA
jgi:hypothetical protein